MITPIRWSDNELTGAHKLKALWSELEAADPELARHGEETATLTSKLICILEAEESILAALYWAARLHDIGKVGVPPWILKKHGPLTSQEQRVVRKHPIFSFLMLRGSGVSSELLHAVLFHHERYDGSGYPLGLEGFNIPFTARVLAVADVYCALTRPRPYRDRYSAEAAWEFMLRGRGAAFHPVVVDALEEVLNRDASNGG